MEKQKKTKAAGGPEDRVKELQVELKQEKQIVSEFSEKICHLEQSLAKEKEFSAEAVTKAKSLQEDLDREIQLLTTAGMNNSYLRETLHRERQKNKPKPLKKLLAVFAVLSIIWISMMVFEVTELASTLLTVPTRQICLFSATFIVGIICERVAFATRKRCR